MNTLNKDPKTRDPAKSINLRDQIYNCQLEHTVNKSTMGTPREVSKNGNFTLHCISKISVHLPVQYGSKIRHK
jgi:hypothetical protein